MKTMQRIFVWVLCFTTAIAAGQYSINSWNAGGGGGTSAGGDFRISGTSGQHSVGSVTGGPFTLTGGFWPVALLQTPGAPTLALTAAGPGQAALTWSPDTRGFYLQISDSLTPALWTNAPSGTNHPVTISTAGPIRFFRLILN
jgi:hypothetical protein